VATRQDAKLWGKTKKIFGNILQSVDVVDSLQVAGWKIALRGGLILDLLTETSVVGGLTAEAIRILGRESSIDLGDYRTIAFTTPCRSSPFLIGTNFRT
jgi:hypothetical protein